MSGVWRVCRALTALLAIVCLLAVLARTAKASVLTEQWDALNTTRLEQQGNALTDSGTELSVDTDLGDGIKKLWEQAENRAGEILRNAVRTGVLLLLVTLLCGVLETAGVSDGGINLTALAGTVSILGLAVGDMQSLTVLARETMDGMNDFSKAVMPTLAAATAAGGNGGSGAARQVAAMFCSDVMLTLGDRLVLPLIDLYVALCAGYAAVGNEGLKRLAALVKKTITVGLTGVLTGYITWLTASSAIAANADRAAARAAGAAISGMVPVVGGILSAATGTVVAGAGLLRSAVGVFGMLTVLGVCLVPFLHLAVHDAVYRITAALASAVSSGRVSGLIADVGSAFGLMMATVGASAVVLLVALIAGIGGSV